MKYLSITSLLLVLSIVANCQSDSTKTSKSDTIVAGNFIIIKKEKDGVTVNDTSANKQKEKLKNKFLELNKNIKTNYFVLDLGFANYQDNTDYATAQSKGYIDTKRPIMSSSGLALNAGKSSNVNIWLFMQKVNLYKNVLNLKYGLGLEMFNFRFDKNVSYRNSPEPTVFMDSISFTKNKLYLGYLTVPVMFNIKMRPSKPNSLSLSGGISASYLAGTHVKQISGERGKQKFRGDFDFNRWRLAAIGEIGVGPVRLYGSYSFTPIQKSSTGLEQMPFAVGIRFSKW